MIGHEKFLCMLMLPILHRIFVRGHYIQSNQIYSFQFQKGGSSFRAASPSDKMAWLGLASQRENPPVSFPDWFQKMIHNICSE